MRACVLHEYGRPRAGPFREPEAGDGVRVVEVAAAPVNHLDLAKASGRFYTGPPPLPSVVGSDGVGRLADGRRVYFDETVAPFGALAERTLVPEETLFDVAEGADDAVAAALGNAGLAAWLSLTWRAELQAGETVLVLGAAGAVGSIAVQAARILGAGRVVAAARHEERLARCRALGADAVVDLEGEGDLAAAMRVACAGGPHVVIDLLWGAPGLAAMQAAARGGARHVQIGQLAGHTVELPAPVVRSAPLDLLGHANFHVPRDVRRAAYLELTSLAAREELAVDLERVPLAEIEAAWQRQGEGAGTKLIVVP
jgi:NADPH:quinone reductase-like Zn-dependent oxidoreductase